VKHIVTNEDNLEGNRRIYEVYRSVSAGVVYRKICNIVYKKDIKQSANEIIIIN